MTLMYRTGVFLLLLVSLACKKENSTLENQTVAEDKLNVTYGPGASNKMDIFLPEKRDLNTKVVVFVHGGSWYEGDKGDLAQLAKYFRDKGYATATINYRLTNTPEKNVHPAQVNDIEKAISFLASNASEFKISPDAYALFGASAGAHLSLLYTYAFNANGKVKTVISMAGPSNFTDTRNANPYQFAVVEWLLGSSLQANPSLYQQASPYFNIKSTSRPTLLIHGKLDAVVPYQQSVDLKSKLDQFQVKSKLITYDNTGHEVINAGNTATFLAECNSWLTDNLK